MDSLGPICICHTPADAEWSRALAAELASLGVPASFYECYSAEAPEGHSPSIDVANISMLLGVLSPESVSSKDFQITITHSTMMMAHLNDENAVTVEERLYRRIVFVVTAPCEIPWNWGHYERSYTVLNEGKPILSPDQAALQILKELQREEKDPKVRAQMALELANALSRAGRYDEALDEVEMALTLQPNDAYAWGCKADILCEAGRLDEGLEAYDTALAIEPWNEPTWTLKGLRLTAANRHAEALTAFDAATALDSSDGDTWEKKGDAYLALSRQVEAVIMYQRALDSEKSFEVDNIRKPRILRNMAEILRTLGNEPGAAYTEAKARDIENSSSD